MPDEADRRQPAEVVVAIRLGEILVDVAKELRRMPRWSPCPRRTAYLRGKADMGVILYYEWKEAFGL